VSEPDHARDSVGFTPRVLAIYLVVAGVASVAATVDRASWSGDASWIRIVFSTVGLVAFGGMVAAGLAVWRRWPWGMLAGSIVLLMQVPSVQLWRITYRVSAMPLVEWSLWPRFGLDMSARHRFTLLYHDSVQPFDLRISVMPLLLSCALAYYGWRRLAAVSRWSLVEER